MTCIRRLHNMSRHDGLESVVDQCPVNKSKGLIPLLAAHVVHTVCHMLVAEIKPVTRKVLCRTAEARIGMRTIHVRLRHLCHPLRIIAVGTQPDDRVFPVVQNVADRRKGQIAADRGGLLVGHIAQLVRIIRVPGRADLGLAADHRAVRACAVSAVLRVAGDDQRNLAVFL